MDLSGKSSSNPYISQFSIFSGMPAFSAPNKRSVFLVLLVAIACCGLNAYVVKKAQSNYKDVFDANKTDTQWKEFQIKFDNVQRTYKMAVFPSDDNICENARLLVIVPTRPTSFGIRSAIRQSWAKDLPPGVIVKFVVGFPTDPNFLYMLLLEQELYEDLMLNNIEDTYENLYLKVHSAFSWQQTFCKEVDYILKADDDTIVDLERLLYWIDNKMASIKQDQSSLIFGRIEKWGWPIRSPGRKWYVPRSLFPRRYYPPFAYGPMYLLTKEAVSDILDNSSQVKAFPNEDVLYTGVIAEKAGIARMDISEHFRGNRKLHNACQKQSSVPSLVSLYGFSNATEFTPYYQALHALECR
ncbi:galactosyltransferase domain-containing protein [Ditylenchus destructor]|uniref:Hexosyltransferase n=1 Tax=Ditylenchus destructor TaxID=166010 RepID=A0AAD4MPW7_9BILA|nr:galactosyltransferase domain-containing protein [Ditylenchus destructor]